MSSWGLAGMGDLRVTTQLWYDSYIFSSCFWKTASPKKTPAGQGVKGAVSRPAGDSSQPGWELCTGAAVPAWLLSQSQHILWHCQLHPRLWESSRSSVPFVPFMQLPLSQIKSIPQEPGRSPSPRLSNAWASTHHIFNFSLPCFMMKYLRAIV